MTYFHRKFLPYIFLFFLATVNCQEITVIDSETNSGISSVLLYNGDKSISKLTNLNGEVSIDIFKNQDTITFSHVSYDEQRISIDKLKSIKEVILTTNSRGLDEVVLSVARNKQNIKTLSKKVSIIDAKTVELENIKTSALGKLIFSKRFSKIKIFSLLR